MNLCSVLTHDSVVCFGDVPIVLKRSLFKLELLCNELSVGGNRIRLLLFRLFRGIVTLYADDWLRHNLVGFVGKSVLDIPESSISGFTDDCLDSVLTV
jgi:hypothetical protein